LLQDFCGPIIKQGSNKKKNNENLDSIISSIKIHSPNSKINVKQQARISLKLVSAKLDITEESKLKECKSEQN
jgi:uncharacterized membrane protein